MSTPSLRRASYVGIEITDIWEVATTIQTVAQYKNWIANEVRLILPHGAFACGYGRVHSAGVTMDHLLTVDYPAAYLETIRNSAGAIDTPLMRHWFQTRKPLIFKAEEPSMTVPETWLDNFRQHGLVNAIVHAEYDVARCVGTYFSFHRLPEPLGQPQRAILAGITPVLHETLLRVIAAHESAKADCLADLSAKEKVVACCVGEGNSNQEIAAKLGLSENTVKHYLTAILKKTACANRAELAVQIVAKTKALSRNGTEVL
jgi:DNA-binding CsgD family transcriptional regulator